MEMTVGEVGSDHLATELRQSHFLSDDELDQGLEVETAF
jgi:hypothetical protein